MPKLPMSKIVKPGYAAIQIALHWTIAALVIFQLLFGESMTVVTDAAGEDRMPAPLDQGLATAHYWVGISILALVALRIVARLVYGAPAGQAPSALMNRAAGIVHVAFYTLLVAVPATGLLGFYLGGRWGDIHTLGKPIFIVLIALHAVAALFHQFWLKDGTLTRMILPARR